MKLFKLFIHVTLLFFICECFAQKNNVKETKNLINQGSKSQILEEVVITINHNEKSKWRKVNKKTKEPSETTYHGIAESYTIMSSFKIDTETKFNGIRLFIMTNTLNPDGTLNKSFKKKVKPILLINSENLIDNLLSHKIISLNNEEKRFSKFDIEFANTLHLQPGETLTIGLELISENLEKPNLNNVLGILTTKHLLKESKTIQTNLVSEQGYLQGDPLNEDIYFELKVVK